MIQTRLLKLSPNEVFVVFLPLVLFTYWNAVHVRPIKYIEWQSGEEVDHAPSPDVIKSYRFPVRHDLTFLTHERRPEIKYYIYKENSNKTFSTQNEEIGNANKK